MERKERERKLTAEQGIVGGAVEEALALLHVGHPVDLRVGNPLDNHHVDHRLGEEHKKSNYGQSGRLQQQVLEEPHIEVLVQDGVHQGSGLPAPHRRTVAGGLWRGHLCQKPAKKK